MKAFGLGVTGCSVAQIPICFDGFYIADAGSL
jgi:hypothetical protein